MSSQSYAAVKCSYGTEAPFVVSRLSGRNLSQHWESSAAIAAAKLGGVRVVHGRDKGHWLPILVYNKGVRQCLS